MSKIKVMSTADVFADSIKTCWMERNDDGNDVWYECPQCNDRFYFPYYGTTPDQFRFCPTCGALVCGHRGE